jgi:CRP-like cAMP-binding protein
MTTLIHELMKCDLFNRLTYGDIETLLNAIDYRFVTLDSQEILFSPHEHSDAIGIILSGSFDIQKIFPNGKLLILKRKQQYDILAEPALLADYPYYPSTICANRPSRVLIISKENMMKLLELNHQLSLNYLRIISNFNLLLTHRVSILSLDSIISKIAGYLIYDYKMKGQKMISLPFSKKEWAEYMDVSRTSLSRELKELQTRGIIDFDGRTIKILSLDGLEQLLAD